MSIIKDMMPTKLAKVYRDLNTSYNQMKDFLKEHKINAKRKKEKRVLPWLLTTKKMKQDLWAEAANHATKVQGPMIIKKG